MQTISKIKALCILLAIAITIPMIGCSEDEAIFIQTEGTDNYTGALTIIDVPYHELHEGCMYSSYQNGDLGNGESRDILIITPSTSHGVHFVIKIETEAEASYTLFEGSTVSDNGTPINHVNRNRNFDNITEVQVFSAPTVDDTGITLQKEHWGAGKSMGGEERSELEWVLKQSTYYLIRLTNETTSNNYISLVLKWYEHCK